MITGLVNASLRTQRFIALLVSMVVVVSFIALANALIISVFHEYAEVGEKRAILGRLRAIASAGSSFEARLLPQNDTNPMLLQGESEAVMSATLQTWVQELVGEAGGQINSVNNISEVGDDELRLIGLKVNLTGSMDAVHRTVSAIESNRPRLLVREIDIHSNYQQSSSEENSPVELTATIVFLGATTIEEKIPEKAL